MLSSSQCLFIFTAVIYGVILMLFTLPLVLMPAAKPTPSSEASAGDAGGELSREAEVELVGLRAVPLVPVPAAKPTPSSEATAGDAGGG